MSLFVSLYDLCVFSLNNYDESLIDHDFDQLKSLCGWSDCGPH